ncbi:MAG: helix-turn-helix domain-containing protein [Ruminococcus sp.]
MEQELDYIAIGDRIRKYRELSRMTQEQLSESCSLSTGYIGHLERGTRSPSLETLVKISQILRVSLDDLVFGKTEINNNMIKILALPQRKKTRKGKSISKNGLRLAKTRRVLRKTPYDDYNTS